MASSVKLSRKSKAVWHHGKGVAFWNCCKEHLDGEVRLARLAEECRLSVSHFARSFRRSFGTSAHRYLILHRIDIAKGLLSETNNSLVEIAAQTGFSDQAALTRAFANHRRYDSGKMEARKLRPQDFRRSIQGKSLQSQE
jgi:transcriptional regulator GlxA family with amidase domain